MTCPWGSISAGMLQKLFVQNGHRWVVLSCRELWNHRGHFWQLDICQQWAWPHTGHQRWRRRHLKLLILHRCCSRSRMGRPARMLSCRNKTVHWLLTMSTQGASHGGSTSSFSSSTGAGPSPSLQGLEACCCAAMGQLDKFPVGRACKHIVML